MMSKSTGGSAFPTTAGNSFNGVFPGTGLTIRDYFAGKALQGICTQEQWEYCPADKIAQWAYDIADAMLAAREL
jgi:hypothetical protein